MAFSLISNLGSLESQSKLNVTGAKLNQAIQRLSSGLRINMSGDDAAGLSIANKYRSDITVISQGVRNANDGLSTMQTIDGGLGNISTLLDRASVLSAQGASDTFTGNRDTLQAEFSKVLAEITRQAQSIGLVSGGVNNKSLTTVIGGGSDTFAASNSNNGVQIDLSGSSNQVDAAGLGLSSVNIGALTGSATASGGINFGTAGTTLSAAETLSFKYVGATGTLATATVALTAGQTANSALSQLQNDAGLKAAGITAAITSSGDLKLSSASFFSVSSSVAAGSQTGIGTASIVSSAANSTTMTGLVTTTATGTQKLDFTIGASGTIVSQAVGGAVQTAAQSAASIATAVNGNATLRDAGIFAIYDAGAATTKIVSTKNTFALNAENPVASTDLAVAAGASTITAGTGAGGAAGAKSALDLLKTAVVTLGSVQGTVGAGENRLQQAVDLASSQITNFQAAESRVRDADVASEASNMSRLTVLQQAGIAALAQANQSSQAVLSLLR